jgi:hypothetical protein
MAKSIGKLPAKVYKNNKNADLILFDPLPHKPTTINKGIKTLSK